MYVCPLNRDIYITFTFTILDVASVMTFFTLRLTKICLQALNLLLLAHFEKRYISDVKRRYGFIVAPAAKLLLDLLIYECGVNKV